MTVRLLIALGLLSSTAALAQPFDPEKNPDEMGRALRHMVLTTPASEVGIEPSTEFPKVFGVLMDLPIEDQTATVFSASNGAASLYTSTKFGIIGGGDSNEKVRTAAIAFAKAAGAFLNDSAAAKEFPYPARDHVRFYLLTFDGVRVIDTDLKSIEEGSKFTELFGLGQKVLTELRQADVSEELRPPGN